MRQGRILMLGDIGVDTIWPLPKFPIPGRDGLVDSLKVEIGGAVVNSAIVLDNLGQLTRLLGCLGEDVWAGWILEELAQTKIDLSYLHSSADAVTMITFIIATDDGERTMFSHRGVNTLLEPQNMKEEMFEDASILHISGYALLKKPQRDAVWRAVELAKKHNVSVSLDTGLEPAITNSDDLRELLKELTICISGPEEVSALLGSKSTEEAANLLLSSGVQIAAIKLGREGSYVANSDESFLCPAFEVDSVDSTGAGDSYSAGLLYGWKNEVSLTGSTVLATTLGALATTVYGAGFALPKKETILDFLKTKQRELTGRQRTGALEAIKCLSKE